MAIERIQCAIRYLYDMKVKHLVSYEHIGKRVVRRLKAETGARSVEFKLSLSYPVRYWFHFDGQRSSFWFDHSVINDLLTHTKFVRNPYQFVIETIYYSCLKEMLINEKK